MISYPFIILKCNLTNGDKTFKVTLELTSHFFGLRSWMNCAYRGYSLVKTELNFNCPKWNELCHLFRIVFENWFVRNWQGMAIFNWDVNFLTPIQLGSDVSVLNYLIGLALFAPLREQSNGNYTFSNQSILNQIALLLNRVHKNF